MSINLVTYANQTVTPTNDAIIYERAIDQNGIFYGCNVTVSGNEVHITGGYGIVCGREFTIESEAIAVTLAPSGTLDGRLYVRLDLADADAPIQLLTTTGNTLPPLEQDADVNYTNGTWEMELATFTVGVSALSDVVETYETIVGAKEGYINIDTTAASGVDHDLYAAITALGWDSDVIDNGVLNQKVLGTKLMDKVTVKFGTFTKSQGGMTNNIVVRQFGEVVTINGWVSNATITANTTTKIGEISNVTMPPDVIRTYCNVGGNAYQVGTLSYIGLGTNGEIGVTSSNGGSGKAIFFEMAYITGVES